MDIAERQSKVNVFDLEEACAPPEPGEILADLDGDLIHQEVKAGDVSVPDDPRG
jgi:hypothetical protein